MAEFNPVHTTSIPPSFPTNPLPFSLTEEAWLAGSSAAIAQLRAQFRRVAPYFRTALLTGERGCGEAIAARILHQMSPLKDRAFVELTPSATELRFNHNDAKAGALDGMLFLHQPERLPRSSQVSLLRILREHGAQAPRIVAFAERGLRFMVSSGGFSADLADALTALRITMPSLRDRADDIPALLTHMLQTLSGQRNVSAPAVTSTLLETAVKLPWPGNLAQLHAAAVGLLARSSSGPLRAEDLISVLGTIIQPSLRERHDIRMLRLDDVIQEHIRAVLSACNGNKLRTAEVLGISRSTLYRMLEAQGSSSSLPMYPQNLQMTG